MRCESCGRTIQNAEMWEINNRQEAPNSRSLRLLCIDCQREASRQFEQTAQQEPPQTFTHDSELRSA
jgi:hypothetical protein